MSEKNCSIEARLLQKEFEDDFNLSVRKMLVDAGYLSYEFIPPIDDPNWDKFMCIFPQPVQTYVENRLRKRTKQDQHTAVIAGQKRTIEELQSKIQELEKIIFEMRVRTRIEDIGDIDSRATSRITSPHELRILTDSPGVLLSGDHDSSGGGSRTDTQRRERENVAFTPFTNAEVQTQMYVDKINPFFRSPEPADTEHEYQVVTDPSAVLQLQKRLESIAAERRVNPSL